MGTGMAGTGTGPRQGRAGRDGDTAMLSGPWRRGQRGRGDVARRGGGRRTVAERGGRAAVTLRAGRKEAEAAAPRSATGYYWNRYKRRAAPGPPARQKRPQRPLSRSGTRSRSCSAPWGSAAALRGSGCSPSPGASASFPCSAACPGHSWSAHWTCPSPRGR